MRTPSWVHLAATRMCSLFHYYGNIEFSVLFKETFVHLFILMGLGHVLQHFSKGFGAHYNKESFYCFVGFFLEILRSSAFLVKIVSFYKNTEFSETSQ